jgi:hypothetical protein
MNTIQKETTEFLKKNLKNFNVDDLKELNQVIADEIHKRNAITGKEIRKILNINDKVYIEDERYPSFGKGKVFNVIYKNHRWAILYDEETNTRYQVPFYLIKKY